MLMLLLISLLTASLILAGIILLKGFKFFLPFRFGKNPFIQENKAPEEKHFKKNGFSVAKFKEKAGETDFDCIIVGSGISSLLVAAILTKLKKKVLILEKHKKIGGALHNFEKFNHYMLVAHIPAIFGENGLLSSEETQKLLEFASDGKIAFENGPKKPESRCFGTMAEVPQEEDTSFAGTSSKPEINMVPMLNEEKFCALLLETAKTSKEKQIVQEYLEKGRLYVQHRRFHFLMKLVPCPFDRFFHFFNIGQVRTAQEILETPLRDFTDQIIDNPILKNLLQCGYGTPLGFLPVQRHSLGHYFATFFHSLRSQSENAPEMFFKKWAEESGNFHKLIVDPLARAIISRNSQIFTDCEVKHILFDEQNKKAIGVEVEPGNLKIYAPMIVTCSNLNYLVSSLIPKAVMDQNLKLQKLSSEILEYRPQYQTFFAFFGVRMTEREACVVKGKMFNYIFRNNKSNQMGNYDIKQIVEDYVSIPNFEPEKLPFINVFCDLAALKSTDADAEQDICEPDTPDPDYQNFFKESSCGNAGNVEKRYLICIQAPCNFAWFEKWRSTKKGKRGSLYIEQKDAFLDSMLKLFFEAYPFFKGKIAFEPTTCSPLTISHYLGYSYGCTFGSFDADVKYYKKIDHLLKAELVSGLYITGQELAGQPGFFPAVVGSLLTSSAILERNLFTDLSEAASTSSKK